MSAERLRVAGMRALLWLRRWLTQSPCPVTGRRICPWHPDGGNHPADGTR